MIAGRARYSRILDFERFAAIAHGVGPTSSWTWRTSPGWWRPGSTRPRSRTRTSSRRRTHKTLRGPRGGLIFSSAALARQVDKAVFPGTQGGPLMHVIAAKAVALRLAATPEFRADQRRTVENAGVLAEEIAARGGRLVTGGTDNHLMSVDVTPFGVTGREAERLLDDVGITVNKNAIPFDPNPPNIASGIRIGTPATTTRAGSARRRCATVGRLIVGALTSRDEPAEQAKFAAEVREMCGRFPVPGLPER